MKKLDRRIRRTRKLLWNALVSLALETSYDAVSIKSLTQRADVGYATFYRHFKSKDELLTFIAVSTLDDLKSKMAAVDSPRDEAEVVFKHIRSYPQVYRLYVRLPDSNSAKTIVRAELEDMLLARYKPREGANVPLQVALNHIIQCGTGLISWYLDNLDAYTPSEVTTVYADLISRETTALSLDRRSDWSRQPAVDMTDSDLANK